MSEHRDDPIVAIATPAGRGGIGVVRLSFGRWSGLPIVATFVATLCAKPAGFVLTPRHATLVGIHDADGRTIDRGIALLFAAPHSYTGDDVVELQLHGGPTVLRMVVERCLAVAHAFDDIVRMRPAGPGEFTERAFLNDKLDLAQAEAVADLIEAGSEAAVLGAQASLSGTFSNAIHAIVESLIELRALVEATLDFPDEQIDFLEQSDARGRLAEIRSSLAELTQQARRGTVLREGLTVVLIGRPNVGKSSLLNALAESDVAIVTPFAGTTRDRIEETIRLEGIALHVVDTAGIRELGDDEADAVERIGIARTWDAIGRAHVVLHIVEAAAPDEAEDEAIVRRLPARAVRRTIVNKIDLVGEAPRHEADRLFVSAKTGAGIALVRAELLSIAGWQPGAEVGFLARERHLVAMREADARLVAAERHADDGDRQLELFAEELRLAQTQFDRITGVFSADDLLGEVFGRFCIGK